MGERVLVSGGAGGVGTAAVQLAAAAGATVTASVRDPGRRDTVAALGAATVIAPGAEGEHGPYDVLLELIGTPSLSAVLPHLATWARVVVIGVGGGGQMELDLMQLMVKRIRIGSSTLRAESNGRRPTWRPPSPRTPSRSSPRDASPFRCATPFPLAGAEAAYERFSQGAKLGKVVLVT